MLGPTRRGPQGSVGLLLLLLLLLLFRTLREHRRTLVVCGCSIMWLLQYTIVVNAPLTNVFFANSGLGNMHVQKMTNMRIHAKLAACGSRKCYKNQLIFNDFVLRRLIDVEDEKTRILCLARGFTLKVNIMNDARPKSLIKKCTNTNGFLTFLCFQNL